MEEIITEQQLAVKFSKLKTIKDCEDFTNYIYSNAQKMEVGLYHQAVNAVNNKRKDLKVKTYTNNNLSI